MVETGGYSKTEIMACTAARLLEDGRSVLVGTGLPIIAAMLAQRTHAPNLLIVFEAGSIGPHLPTLPVSVGESRTFYQAAAASSMHDVMALAQAGYLDFGFLGAAQIDRFGNINTTVIGDYKSPKVRLPGSGGGNDVGSFCHRTIIIMRQDRRKFVECVDFITTPGYLNGPGEREKAGLPSDSGPFRVITQLGAYEFNEKRKTIELVSLHPGVTIEEMLDNSSFEIPVPEEVVYSQPPTELEKRVLKEIDPDSRII